MTHFGIICPASTGHLNAMIPLGCELLSRGHRVTVFGFLDAKVRTVASGLEFQSFAEDECPLGSIAEEFTQRGKLSGLAALQHSLKAGQKRLAPILRDAPTTIKQAGIEALLVDQISLEGGTIADFLNLPFITVCGALLLNREPKIPPIVTTWQYSPTAIGNYESACGRVV